MWVRMKPYSSSSTRSRRVTCSSVSEARATSPVKADFLPLQQGPVLRSRSAKSLCAWLCRSGASRSSTASCSSWSASESSISSSSTFVKEFS